MKMPAITLLLLITAAPTPDAQDNKDAPAWRVIKKGEKIEYNGGKRPSIFGSYGWVAFNDYDLRQRPDESTMKIGEKMARKVEVKGLVLTYDVPKPDKFDNKPVKYLLYFSSDPGATGGPIEAQDEKWMNQGYDNNMFVLEIDAGKPNTPKEILDLNSPVEWHSVHCYAVYPDGSWHFNGVRAKEDSWKEPKSDDPNVIKLPQHYKWQ